MKYCSNILLIFTLVFTSFISILPTHKVYSLDDCSERKLRDLGVIVVECEGGTIVCEDDSSILNGSDNGEKAFNYFLDKGLTQEQSAGILGNMMQESGINPIKVQNGGTVSTSQDPNDAGSLGWGLIQWTPGSRVYGLLGRDNANIPVVENGEAGSRHIFDLDVQLDLVWWHLNNTTPTGRTNVLPDFKLTTTIEEATEFFEDKVEGAGTPALARRIRFAQDAFALYANSAGVQQAGTTTASECISASTLNDDFVVYDQYDERWASEPYASSTIGESGCGPSAMAMIITALTNEVVTPIDTAKVAADEGLYVAGIGTSSQIAPVLAEHYGLISERIATDIETISTALSAGKMVFTGGQGAKPFTDDGHFIVIRGITSNGNWLVGDSGHEDTSNEEQDPQELIISMKERDGSAYAISN